MRLLQRNVRKFGSVVDVTPTATGLQGMHEYRFRTPLAQVASWLKLAAKAVELGGSRLLLKEKKFSPGRHA